MCFNSKTSISTFLYGSITSIILIFYGNKKYSKENKIFGIFFIFISLMQLFDYLFWNDLDNKKGINKLCTIIAPLINFGQPIFLLFIKSIFYKIDNYLILGLNSIYLFNIIINYRNFILNNNLITHVEEKHLKWQWLSYFNSYFYLIMLVINILYFTNFLYSLNVICITLFFLIISYQYFGYHIGEIWCFFGVFIPIIILIMSYFI